METENLSQNLNVSDETHKGGYIENDIVQGNDEQPQSEQYTQRKIERYIQPRRNEETKELKNSDGDESCDQIRKELTIDDSQQETAESNTIETNNDVSLEETNASQNVQFQNSDRENIDSGTLSFGNPKEQTHVPEEEKQIHSHSDSYVIQENEQETPDIHVNNDTQPTIQVPEVCREDDDVSKEPCSNENAKISDTLIKNFENAVLNYIKNSSSIEADSNKDSILNSINSREEISAYFDKIRCETFNQNFEGINKIEDDNKKISIICSTFKARAKLDTLKENFENSSDTDKNIKNLREINEISSIKRFENKNFKSSETDKNDHSLYNAIPRMEKCKFENKTLSGKFVYGDSGKSVIDMEFKINGTIGNFYVNHAACECSILLNILLEHNGDLSKCGIKINKAKIEKLDDLKNLDKDLFKAFTACENYEKFLYLANSYGFCIENKKTAELNLQFGDVSRNANPSVNKQVEFSVLGKEEGTPGSHGATHVKNLERSRLNSSTCTNSRGL